MPPILEAMMGERLRSDLLGAVRSLSATPIPVAAAVFTLAVAIGVNLAMLGLIDRALLSPAAHPVGHRPQLRPQGSHSPVVRLWPSRVS